MPPPNLAHLQADPASLLTWLNNNMLLGGYLANVVDPQGLAWVTMLPPPAIPYPAHADDGAGQAIDVYALRSNGAGVADSVRAYVCNYTAGDVESVVLGSLADYCFTTNLNGCSFGVGPMAPNGTRRVSHANTGGATTQQRTQTWTEHHVAANSTTISMLEPAEYRRLGGGASLQATVFGIRTGRQWRFYYQSYTAAGQGHFVVHGVIPIRTP